MNLSLYNLKILKMLYEEESVKAVAENMFISQSAVSHKLRVMEKYFGVELFERKGRNIVPTKVGHITYDYVNTILNEFEKLHIAVQDVKDSKTGEIKFAGSVNLGTYVLPSIVSEFKEDFPDLYLNLHVYHSNEALKFTALAEAEQMKVPIAPIKSTHPQFSVDEAYAVQLENIKKRVEQGQEIVGKKIGLTSKVVQEMLGVSEPDYGHLLSDVVVENRATVDISKLLQPKIEGEIAFVLKQDLVGPNITAQDVITATDYVVLALEIVDSRIENWKITLQDTVADNASASLFVLGNEKTTLDNLYLLSIHMELYKNDEKLNEGTGAAALGNPATCVAWLANKLSDYGITLKAGEVILSGALSGMVVVEKSDSFTAKFDCLGDVCVRFD